MAEGVLSCREGQVWKVTNMMKGWTIFLITRSDDGMHVGVVLDGAGPSSGDVQGQTIVTFENDWERDPESYERIA